MGFSYWTLSLSMRPPRGALNENWTFICCSKKRLALASFTLCLYRRELPSFLVGLALYDGWHKKSCHTNVLCKNGIDSISLSCCSGSTYKMVWLFMSFFALQKPNHPFETIFISGARLVHCSLLWTPNSSKWHCFFLSKGLVCTRCR